MVQGAVTIPMPLKWDGEPADNGSRRERPMSNV
jgi:hypothetical protein